MRIGARVPFTPVWVSGRVPGTGRGRTSSNGSNELAGALLGLALVSLFFAWPFLLPLGGNDWTVAAGWWAWLLGMVIWGAQRRHAKKQVARRAEAAKRYSAVIKTGDVVTWRCEHSHKTLAEADQCAQRHLAERKAKRQEELDRRVELENKVLTARVNQLATGTQCKNCGAVFDPTRGPCPYCTRVA